MEKTEQANDICTATATGRILAVDDEVFYLRLIEKYLNPAGFDVVTTDTGTQALTLLREQGDGFDAVLLDRGIPDIDGMQILTQMKSDPRLKDLPVIIQTGLAEPKQVAEGMALGAFYYLAKPFSREVLSSIVAAAIDDYAMLRRLRSQLQQNDSGHALLRRGEFVCRTLTDVQALASHLAMFFPEPSRVVSGISEFLTNAVEHGNLGISYADKSLLLREGRWLDEINRRLETPAYSAKQVRVELECLSDRVRLTVKDEGPGFNWRAFMDLDPVRAFDLHGRGIALSRLMSFDQVEFNSAGNMVQLTVNRRRDA